MKSKFELLFDLNKFTFNLAGKLKWIEYFLLHQSAFKKINKAKELVDEQGNMRKKCYIIGLGPSLKDVNLNKIKGDSFVLNRFFKAGSKYPDFVPTYYHLTDGQFTNEENIRDFEECMRAYSKKGTRYIMDATFAEESILKQYETDVFYYILSFTGLLNPTKDYYINKPLPILFNTVCSCILLAILMGYKEIVLLGCDFNSFATPMPQHCYEENRKEKLRTLSMELFCYSFAADTHYELQRYAVRNGVKITNSTKGSLIDAYPIVVEEELYNI